MNKERAIIILSLLFIVIITIFSDYINLWIVSLFEEEIISSTSDKDRDGLIDINDRCPDKAGPKDLVGCPDRDGDMIPDIKDKCPNKIGLKKYNGCP